MTKKARSFATGGVFAAALVVGSLSAQQPPAAGGAAALTILQRASARYRTATAVCADFAQELSVPLIGQKKASKGQICLKTPGLFAMTFSDPRGDRIVLDGTNLWTYLPSSQTGQKSVFQTPAASGNSLDFRREFLDNPEAKYNVRLNGKETVDGKPADRVVLVPKQRSAYSQATLWIGADSIVRRMQYQEDNGTVKVLSFSNINLRANPSAETFRFTPPAGVQVVKQP